MYDNLCIFSFLSSNGIKGGEPICINVHIFTGIRPVIGNKKASVP